MTQSTLAAVFMTQHDTAPALRGTLSDADDAGVTTPVDLTSATTVKVIGSQAGINLFTRTVTGTNQGVVVMNWQAADTATPGAISIKFRVTWPDGTVQSFPPSGWLTVFVERGLDAIPPV